VTVEAERYWKDFETETGELVEKQAMGQCFAGNEERWGLLILTDRSFRFREVPSENWLGSLVKGRRTLERKQEPLELVVPREGLLRAQSPRLGFLSRLFPPPWPRLQLSWREGETTRECGFAVDNHGRFIEGLEAALASKA
jgi:hypothetical protein